MIYRKVTEKYLDRQFRWWNEVSHTIFTTISSDHKVVNVGYFRGMQGNDAFFARSGDRCYAAHSAKEMSRCLLKEFGVVKKPQSLKRKDVSNLASYTWAAKRFGTNQWHGAMWPGYNARLCETINHRGHNIQLYQKDVGVYYVRIEPFWDLIGPMSYAQALSAQTELTGWIDAHYNIHSQESFCINCEQRRTCKILNSEYGSYQAKLSCKWWKFDLEHEGEYNHKSQSLARRRVKREDFTNRLQASIEGWKPITGLQVLEEFSSHTDIQ